MERLTPREREVLEGLSRGLTQGEIAIELGIAMHTVKFHTTQIYLKIDARNAAHAVAIYTRSLFEAMTP